MERDISSVPVSKSEKRFLYKKSFFFVIKNLKDKTFEQI